MVFRFGKKIGWEQVLWHSIYELLRMANENVIIGWFSVDGSNLIQCK